MALHTIFSPAPLFWASHALMLLSSHCIKTCTFLSLRCRFIPISFPLNCCLLWSPRYSFDSWLIWRDSTFFVSRKKHGKRGNEFLLGGEKSPKRTPKKSSERRENKVFFLLAAFKIRTFNMQGKRTRARSEEGNPISEMKSSFFWEKAGVFIRPN